MREIRYCPHCDYAGPLDRAGWLSCKACGERTHYAGSAGAADASARPQRHGRAVGVVAALIILGLGALAFWPRE